MGDFSTLGLQEYLKETSDLIFRKGVDKRAVNIWTLPEQCTKLVYHKMTSIPTLRNTSDIILTK